MCWQSYTITKDIWRPRQKKTACSSCLALYSKFLFTWISSSLELKSDSITFSPSETRVREIPKRPAATSCPFSGTVLDRQIRMVFTKLKDGWSGPKNLFRASFDTRIMLAPASPARRERKTHHETLQNQPSLLQNKAQKSLIHSITQKFLPTGWYVIQDKRQCLLAVLWELWKFAVLVLIAKSYPHLTYVL